MTITTPKDEPFADRLEHIGRLQHVPARRLAPIDRHAVRDRNAGRLQHDLGEILLHRQRRGQHPRMGVGNAQDFEHALDRAVLADRGRAAR